MRAPDDLGAPMKGTPAMRIRMLRSALVCSTCRLATRLSFLSTFIAYLRQRIDWQRLEMPRRKRARWVRWAPLTGFRRGQRGATHSCELSFLRTSITYGRSNRSTKAMVMQTVSPVLECQAILRRRWPALQTMLRKKPVANPWSQTRARAAHIPCRSCPCPGHAQGQSCPSSRASRRTASPASRGAVIITAPVL